MNKPDILIETNRKITSVIEFRDMLNEIIEKGYGNHPIIANGMDEDTRDISSDCSDILFLAEMVAQRSDDDSDTNVVLVGYSKQDFMSALAGVIGTMGAEDLSPEEVD